MHHKLDLEYLSPVEASAMLADLAEQIANGTIVIDDHPITVAGPMAVSMEIDTGQEVARISLGIDCRRPVVAPRRLQEELARPGG